MVNRIRKIDSYVRELLKKPFGGSKVFSTEKAVNFLKTHNAQRNGIIVSVGDICSSELIKHGYIPDIIIFDTKFLRKNVNQDVRDTINTACKKRYYVPNDPGTVNHEAEKLIKRLIKNHEKACVQIEGEEDLLALVAVIECWEGDCVIYGQPHEGMVIVRVDEQMVEQAKKIYNMME